MNTITRRTAYQAKRFASTQSEGQSLVQRARRDPELFPLWAIVGATIAGAAWYLSRNPTSSSSENTVGHAKGSEPWHTGKDAKYEFHPHGDPRNPKKEAPSALNEVIIPNVTLPKKLHDKFNKYGKDGY